MTNFIVVAAVKRNRNRNTQSFNMFVLESISIVFADSDSDSKSDGYIVLSKHVRIAQTQTQIPTPYFCIRQESES